VVKTHNISQESGGTAEVVHQAINAMRF